MHAGNPDSGRTLRILHIEDSAEDRELIARQLAHDGLRCEVLPASCEDEFRHALESTHPDVILSDFTLPSFGGLEALKLAKEKRPEVPFIFVSGTIGEQRAIESLHAGATDYVLKDRLERLATAIRRAVQDAQHEAEHARAIAALRESEERFRQVTENIEEVFWLADVSPRRIVYVSPAYEQIWGKSCEQLQAAPNSWLESVHPDDRGKVEAAIARQASGDYDIEYRIVRPGGAVRLVNDRAFPIRNAAGVVYRLAGVAQDITARRDLEREARQANKIDALGKFAGGIAHDFNNVLAIVQMQASLLLEDPHLSTNLQAGLENIMTAAVRAANLTRQLLTFSRRDLSQARDIDLAEVVSTTMKLLRRIVGENIAFSTRFAPGLPAVHADPAMIEQVLMNLVINARDAMPNGGNLTVAIDAEVAGSERVAAHAGVKPGRFACLSVTDTGCGIPAENLARIFEPFFTTKEAGCGTGLGLANVMRIVTQHHGWIDVESDCARGTTFRVYLPARDHPAHHTETPPAPLPHGNGERILLVEDDEAVCTVARALLERFGYRVADASSTATAIQRWEEQEGNFDLLITDLVLPGGVSASEMVRHFLERRPNLAVIFTSGHSADIVARHLPAGKDHAVLQKPFSTERLVSTVRNCLESGRKGAE